MERINADLWERDPAEAFKQAASLLAPEGTRYSHMVETDSDEYDRFNWSHFRSIDNKDGKIGPKLLNYSAIYVKHGLQL